MVHALRGDEADEADGSAVVFSSEGTGSSRLSNAIVVFKDA